MLRNDTAEYLAKIAELPLVCYALTIVAQLATWFVHLFPDKADLRVCTTRGEIMKWVVPLLLIVAGLLMAGCQLTPTVPERPVRIAFMTDRDGDFEIYLMGRDGSNLTNLTADSAADGLPAWSRQAGAFAFASNRAGDTLSIYRMGDDGREPMILTESPPAAPVPMIWSPTGEWIGFGSGADVYLLDPHGDNLVKLTEHPARDNFEAWSPDGRQVLFTSERDDTLAIYVTGVEGSEPTRLTELESGSGSPDWSPDGTKIAFVSNRDGDIEIYVMDADGGNVMRLTESVDFDGYPTWSPDGSKIAFLSRRDGNTEIYVMNPDGSEQTNLTNSPDSEESLQGDFFWSPDGEQIMFHTDRDGDVEIYVMDADGSNQTNLSDNPATDFGSIWVD